MALNCVSTSFCLSSDKKLRESQWTDDKMSNRYTPELCSESGEHCGPGGTLQRISSPPSQIRHQRLDWVARILTLTLVTVMMVTGKETRTFDKHSFLLVTSVARMTGGARGTKIWVMDQSLERMSPTQWRTRQDADHSKSQRRDSVKELCGRMSGHCPLRSPGSAPQVFVVCKTVKVKIHKNCFLCLTLSLLFSSSWLGTSS